MLEKIKAKKLSLIILTCLVSFSVYQGHQSYLEIEDFENRFQKTNLSKHQLEEDTTFQIEIAETNLPTQKIEDSSDNLSVYQPTAKDPLLHISEEIQKGQVFQELSDFSRDELEIVLKNKNRPELAEVSSQVIRQLQRCLTDGRCVEEVDPSSSYYREGHTRAHQLLERTLHTLIIIQEEDETLRDNLSFDDKIAILDVNNSEIQRLAIELLGTQQLSSEQILTILNKDHQIDQEAQGALFTQVERFTREGTELRKSYLEHLEKKFSTDAAAAIEILKVLPFTRLEKNEIAQVSRGLCLHQKGEAPQNWQAIEYHHSLYQDSQGISTRLSSLCSAQ